MTDRRAVVKATARRYQLGRKKEKQKLLDEFTKLTGWALWGEAEILRLSWRVPEATQTYTKAFEVFSEHDLAGRSWSLEGRAQCKLISGGDPLSDITSARHGFSRLKATIGGMATRVDLAVYYMRCNRTNDAELVLSAIDHEKFPLKDQANFWLVTAELAASQQSDKALTYYKRAIGLYRKLDMAHATLESSISWHCCTRRSTS